MKKVILASLVLLSACAWAGPIPNPASYPVNVHVVASHYLLSPGGIKGGGSSREKLDVMIEGKKYELISGWDETGLLAPGDYKARLSKDKHKTTFRSSQEYELLFPDNTTRKYEVTGQTE